ncbi:MAG: hypothetical protein U0L88_11520 [Acutalibacteraceae bacterium]|nr:hypothetical protein [Acutalibacteraceae bacterium]
MAEIVFGIILIFPAMLGLAEMLHTFKMHLLSSPKRCERVLVVYPDDENFPRQIMKTAEERKWQGEKFAQRVLVSVKNISEENSQDVKDLALKYGFEILKEDI